MESASDSASPLCAVDASKLMAIANREPVTRIQRNCDRSFHAKYVCCYLEMHRSA